MDDDGEVYACPSEIEKVASLSALVSRFEKPGVSSESGNKISKTPAKFVFGNSQPSSPLKKKAMPIPMESKKPDLQPKPVAHQKQHTIPSKSSAIAGRASIFGEVRSSAAFDNNTNLAVVEKPNEFQSAPPVLLPKHGTHNVLKPLELKHGKKQTTSDKYNDVSTGPASRMSILSLPPPPEVIESSVRISFPPPPNENQLLNETILNSSEPYSPVKVLGSIFSENRASGYEDIAPPRPPKNDGIRPVSNEELTTKSNAVSPDATHTKAARYQLRVFKSPLAAAPLKPRLPDNVQPDLMDILALENSCSVLESKQNGAAQSVIRQKDGSTKRRLPSVPPVSSSPVTCEKTITEEDAEENPDYESVDQVLIRNTRGSIAGRPLTQRSTKAVSRIKSMTEEEEEVQEETYDDVLFKGSSTPSTQAEEEGEEDTYDRL